MWDAIWLLSFIALRIQWVDLLSARISELTSSCTEWQRFSRIFCWIPIYGCQQGFLSSWPYWTIISSANSLQLKCCRYPCCCTSTACWWLWGSRCWCLPVEFEVNNILSYGLIVSYLSACQGRGLDPIQWWSCFITGWKVQAYGCFC